MYCTVGLPSVAWYQDRSFILALSILIQQHEGVPQYDIYILYIYIYIHVIRDQSLITVRGGLQIEGTGGGVKFYPYQGPILIDVPAPTKK